MLTSTALMLLRRQAGRRFACHTSDLHVVAAFANRAQADQFVASMLAVQGSTLTVTDLQLDNCAA